jgi:hypothetical protein
MIASSSQSARLPLPQAKVPSARQIRKAEKLEKRASMHGSRHPGRLDGAIGRLTQVCSRALRPLFTTACTIPVPSGIAVSSLHFVYQRTLSIVTSYYNLQISTTDLQSGIIPLRYKT